MALKTKSLAFYAKDNLFIGNNADNNGERGLVTFDDNSNLTAEAREKTDDSLKDNKVYEQLRKLAKRDIYNFNINKQNPLQSRAFKATIEIWDILFHNNLIEILRENGWTILEYPENLGLPTLKDENHMII